MVVTISAGDQGIAGAVCGKCVRGLLCLSCNTTLGLIERKYELAQAYLDNPPAQLAVVDAA